MLSQNEGGLTMTSIETAEGAIHRMAVLGSMSLQDLIVFFYSKEGQTEVRESIVLENEG
jgi:hypothetical protein